MAPLTLFILKLLLDFLTQIILEWVKCLVNPPKLSENPTSSKTTSTCVVAAVGSHIAAGCPAGPPPPGR